MMQWVVWNCQQGYFPQKLDQETTSKQTLILRIPSTLLRYWVLNNFWKVIDLSNFGNKKFNRLAFKEFLDQIQDMRTLHTLKLRNN